MVGAATARVRAEERGRGKEGRVAFASVVVAAVVAPAAVVVAAFPAAIIAAAAVVAVAAAAASYAAAGVASLPEPAMKVRTEAHPIFYIFPFSLFSFMCLLSFCRCFFCPFAFRQLICCHGDSAYRYKISTRRLWL